MEQSDSPIGHHLGGITNYFQGATIHNLVINGNMTRSGQEHYHATHKQYHNEHEIAQALEAICGKGKAIDNKQKWAGAYWYLKSTCGFPVDAKEFCRKVNLLPFSQPLEFLCDYNNIRRLTTLSFMSQDYRNVEEIKPSRMDLEVFQQCREVAQALDRELNEKSEVA